MKTAIYLERHVYAPELNTIHYIKNGERYSVSAPGVKTISS